MSGRIKCMKAENNAEKAEFSKSSEYYTGHTHAQFLGAGIIFVTHFGILTLIFGS